MKIPLNKNTIGSSEKKALNKVLNSGYMTMGKVTESLNLILQNLLVQNMLFMLILVPQQIFWPFLQFLITIN